MNLQMAYHWVVIDIMFVRSFLVQIDYLEPTTYHHPTSQPSVRDVEPPRQMNTLQISR